MMTEEQVKAEIDNNKNKHDVRCNYCNSLVLKAQMSTYIDLDKVQLPLMQVRKKNEKFEVEFETFRHFWHVRDMYDFENVGFTHTVEDKKFLTCADCEMGPIGYKNTKSNDCYVAIQRVRHGSADTGVTSEINTELEMKVAEEIEKEHDKEAENNEDSAKVSD